jgi:hypothetical protein
MGVAEHAPTRRQYGGRQRFALISLYGFPVYGDLHRTATLHIDEPYWQLIPAFHCCTLVSNLRVDED